MKKGILILLFTLSCCVLIAQPLKVYEAESALLNGTASVTNCANASNGQMINNLSGGVSNSITFENINLTDGTYVLSISYYSTTARTFTYKINNENPKTISIPLSGVWCYQGGAPVEFAFQETFSSGLNKIVFYDSPIIDKFSIVKIIPLRNTLTYYVSSQSGQDTNDGLSPTKALKTIAKANALSLLPGDSLLFKNGEVFKGRLTLNGMSGGETQPIIISNYGNGSKPIIDGDGYLSAVYFKNSEFIEISNLEIINDKLTSQAGVNENLRYGIFIENTTSNTLGHYRLQNLSFRDIYQTTQISSLDQTGINAYAIYTNCTAGAKLNDMLIENCYFTKTSRHATFLKSVSNLVLRNNLFEHVGGAGMVIGSGCVNILVENNITNHTGSSLNSRMAGRGSGIWAWNTTNLVVQHNRFMNAMGEKDSYGMHIDLGNRNVVYQYNYSENNEGGFVEILGKNVNVGYRYNVSVGDGWRKRGPTHGQIIWITGWSGDVYNPIGSDSIFVYNNSVYIRDSVAPGILIEAVTKNTRIYNNIIYTAKNFGSVVIKNNSTYNDFSNNIWYGNIPDKTSYGNAYRGSNDLVLNPLFVQGVVTNENEFKLQPNSPAIGTGKLIKYTGTLKAFDYYINNGDKDYFGNPVSKTIHPNIGAFNGSITNGNNVVNLNDFKLYPNPKKKDESIIVEIPFDSIFSSYKIQMYDITGKLRYEREYENQFKIFLNPNELSAGLYFVKISNDENKIIKKFIAI